MRDMGSLTDTASSSAPKAYNNKPCRNAKNEIINDSDKYLIVFEHNLQTFINPALILRFDNPDRPNFFGVIDMGPAIGLKIKANDLNNAYFFYIRREQVNFRAYQVGYAKRLFARQRIDMNRI